MAKLDTYKPSINGSVTGSTGVLGITEIDVALGNVSGVSTLIVAGRNPDIDTGTVPEDVWLGGGAYLGFDVAGAETLDLVSTSANDTSTGTGARTALVVGLDGSYNEISELVSLSGTTVSQTTNTFLRVNSVTIITSGSSGNNEGQINITQTTSGTLMSVVGSRVGNDQQALYTVPNGKKVYLKNINATLNDANNTHADFFVQARSFGGSWITSVTVGISQSGGQINLKTEYTVLAARTDIRVRVDSTSSNNTDITTLLSFLVEDV